MNRFDLEEKIQQIDSIEQELQLLLYSIGDSPTRSSEDELMNMVIGMQELHKKRYEQLWTCFEDLVKDGTISNKNTKK